MSGRIARNAHSATLKNIVIASKCDWKQLSATVYTCRGSGDDLLAFVSYPKIFFSALYHPETFPLPRVSLSISDLARAARRELVANVELFDMQLGGDIGELTKALLTCNPDIVGISATFGQQDILDEIMTTLDPTWLNGRTVVFGGSLCALNYRELLERYPNSFVAMGSGEKTVAEIIKYFRGEIGKNNISGISFIEDGKISQNPNISMRNDGELIPELDLVPSTLSKRGVMQLESSRGCSYACSFCPREHKGVWTGENASELSSILPDLERIFSNHPKVARKIFLVDEEFFGYRPNGESENRALSVAKLLNSHNFKFETSSRADQVFRPRESPSWHAKRIDLWRSLVDIGLQRCLFGIESGCDTILGRFNKKNSAEANAIAIRMLSLAHVPPRYTFILFDPLMSIDELKENIAFLAREDLLLKGPKNLSGADIYNISTTELSFEYVDKRPFYLDISYMLVSMECLRGAPYTEMARKAGLLKTFNTNMGRYDSEYLDNFIGLMSNFCQRWIDGNFAADYTLKSLEKVSGGEKAGAIRVIRELYKRQSFSLLTDMLLYYTPNVKISELGKLENVFMGLIQRHHCELAKTMEEYVNECSLVLEMVDNTKNSLLDGWSKNRKWELIN